MTTLYIITLCLSAFFVTVIGTGVAWWILKQGVLDEPNERDNHTVATPRGGGIAVMVSAIGFLLVAGTDHLVLWGVLGLAIISFRDDAVGVPVRYRLLVQIGAIALAIPALGGPVFQGLLPLPLDWFLAGGMWLLFLNLTNFMDGIDGITGVETVHLGIGLAVLAIGVPHLPLGIGIDGLILAASLLGFLCWNWHPARIFLGDVGSATLGYLLGLLLLQAAVHGAWAAALILPAYYLIDTGLTVLKRALKGEKIWQAHSQHGYQRAVRRGWPHDRVVRCLIGVNIGLTVLAVVSTQPYMELPALVTAYALAFALRLYLVHGRLRRPGSGRALAA